MGPGRAAKAGRRDARRGPVPGLWQEGGPVRQGDGRAAVRAEALGRVFQSDRALQPELRLLLYSGEDAPPRTAHVPRRLVEALAILKRYFRTTVPKGVLPQIIFHGAEPLLNREAVFAGIEQFANDFRFGIQTNATLLDDAAIAFLREHEVSIGISLDRRRPPRRPHPQQLGRPRRLPASRRGYGPAQGLSRLERHLHGVPRKPAAPDEAGGVSPRTRGSHLPDEHSPLHAAAVAEREADRRVGGEVFFASPGSQLRAIPSRPDGN